jgi:hypothetical protein
VREWFMATGTVFYDAMVTKAFLSGKLGAVAPGLAWLRGEGRHRQG